MRIITSRDIYRCLILDEIDLNLRDSSCQRQDACKRLLYVVTPTQYPLQHLTLPSHVSARRGLQSNLYCRAIHWGGTPSNSRRFGKSSAKIAKNLKYKKKYNNKFVDLIKIN